LQKVLSRAATTTQIHSELVFSEAKESSNFGKSRNLPPIFP
jgi:hypothetical protein